MALPHVLVLRAAGTNCDLETQHAWELAGATAVRLHIRELSAAPERLRTCQVLTIPGGFSYGDDLGAGRIFAAQLARFLGDALREFVQRGGLVLGICNGFQVLVKAGLLPEIQKTDHAPPSCTVTFSDPPGYLDRWVCLRANDSPSLFLEAGRTYELPMAHGEGRVVFRSPADSDAVVAAHQNALVYVPAPPDSPAALAPYNPNSSTADLAGLCDSTGRVLGLMPHPERFVTWQQHPCWTRNPAITRADGLQFFSTALAALR
ncbi:MAG: phosphoribosylformylglycinamidine synthase subunit PurQ [Deltaproteobacteria bacterium]|nr:phosphoribosylformylglycinamidine synthase subunit PurQ [Deltaproteobacteria bacterium]